MKNSKKRERENNLRVISKCHTHKYGWTVCTPLNRWHKVCRRNHFPLTGNWLVNMQTKQIKKNIATTTTEKSLTFFSVVSAVF